jgi:transcriptional regulator with XRE-family HTH domain
MRPVLIPDLSDPVWLALLRAEQARGKTISQIARETGMARPSVSMLLSGTYPAQSLDLVARKHGARIVRLYRDEVLCPHLRRGIAIEDCRTFAQAPMSTSNPEKLQHWRACRRCPLNPVSQKET